MIALAVVGLALTGGAAAYDEFSVDNTTEGIDLTLVDEEGETTTMNFSVSSQSDYNVSISDPDGDTVVSETAAQTSDNGSFEYAFDDSNLSEDANGNATEGETLTVTVNDETAGTVAYEFNASVSEIHEGRLSITDSVVNDSSAISTSTEEPFFGLYGDTKTLASFEEAESFTEDEMNQSERSMVIDLEDEEFQNASDSAVADDASDGDRVNAVVLVNGVPEPVYLNSVPEGDNSSTHAVLHSDSDQIVVTDSSDVDTLFVTSTIGDDYGILQQVQFDWLDNKGR